MIGQKRIRFTQAHTNDTFGNVWVGREVITSHRQAVRLIGLKLAEEVREKNVNNSNTGRRKAASKGHA